MKFTDEELRFIEKHMDNQTSNLSVNIHKMAEQWLLINTLENDDESLKRLLIKQFEEYLKTYKILKSIRDRIETRWKKHEDVADV